ncbi:MAG: ABC transporter ATP-binding protein/permease [Clostridiales bacterium]|jgi:ATP-binding cassette subfamily B protein|nr:ABC transporter ATP-binding protein/permease [Clostridiales bacterium]
MNEYEEIDYTKSFDFSLWKKLAGFMTKHKKPLIILLVSNTLIAVLDITFPLVTRYAIDNFIMLGDTSNMGWFITVFAVLFFIQAVNIYLFINEAGRMEIGIVYDIRKTGFKKLQELSFSYYDNTPVGWIMARMTTDAQRIGDVLAWSIIDLVWGFGIIVLAFVSMFILNAQIAVRLLAITPFLIAASVFFQRIILKGHRKVRKINSKITGSFNEGINGAKTTKTLVREGKNFEEFESLTSSMRYNSVRVAIVSSILMPTVLIIGSIGVANVVYSGGIQVMTGVLTFGTFTTFVSYSMQIIDPIRQIARIFSDMQSAQASAERTFSLIESEPDVADSPEILKIYGDALNPKPENWPKIVGDIVFENVGFAYKTGERVLENFSLNIKAGEKIALVGETGAGKSTIVNLICRFYEPTEGTIYIDGTDYKKRSQIWLQSNLGYVLQTPHLFSGSVTENIRYANLEATDEEIIEAAKRANAYDFIMKLPDGFNTEVGEGGNRLSSGEKQLVSFARAILSNPVIFVLDEATSSVDTETEQVIQTAIDRVLKGRTSFIIAHRLSTIRSCDRILLIHDGKVVEEGTHKELLRKKGQYYDLYTNQFKEEAENRLLTDR